MDKSPTQEAESVRKGTTRLWPPPGAGTFVLDCSRRITSEGFRVGISRKQCRIFFYWLREAHLFVNRGLWDVKPLPYGLDNKMIPVFIF